MISFDWLCLKRFPNQDEDMGIEGRIWCRGKAMVRGEKKRRRRQVPRTLRMLG